MYLSVIYILWLRQLKRYMRSRSRIIVSVAQPMLFLVAFGFGFGPIYAKAGGGDYIQFLAPGVIVMAILFTAMFSGIEVIWDKQFGFLKETLVAPVPRLAIVFGRTLGGATVAILQGFIVFLITFLVGFHPQSAEMVIISSLFMFLIALLFTTLGTAIASRLNNMQAFPLVINLLLMPMFFLSGALFPIDTLPTMLALVVKSNPLSYGVDAVRDTLVGIGHFGLATDITVLLVVTAIVIVVSAYLFEKIEA
ncbi:MAG: ABC transporter, permease protein [Parcubacteria group bacterium GW2011_GWA1_47_8]|nr:MAG: ABC transporter, permease protein [Parcubacteria group bacterium GW2011_GWA1_47_8]KKW07912.1 MAG: ABC transporter, permease protein [Parcubacteria group bacterium GW2011_GWA2_49_16]